MLFYKIYNQIVREIKNFFFGYNNLKYKFLKYYNVLTDKKIITFNKNKFFYDNPNTPLLLDNFYNDLKFLKKYISVNSKILDIGANIGQFSIILNSLMPNIKILAYEPNRIIFNLLKKNCKSFKNIKINNFGISYQNEKKILYFVNNKSSQGSYYKSNSTFNLTYKNITKTKTTLKKLKTFQYFDLVKIDTEGYELNILKSFKNIYFKYLYIENSENIYPYLKNYEFLKKIENIFKDQNKKIINIKTFERNFGVYDNFIVIKNKPCLR
jgi:FkbM family methyltransferase